MPFFSLFFFNDTATTEIYTLSLHDALPIYYRHTLLLCFGSATWQRPLGHLEHQQEGFHCHGNQAIQETLFGKEDHFHPYQLQTNLDY